MSLSISLSISAKISGKRREKEQGYALKRRELEFVGNCFNSTLEKSAVTGIFLNQKLSRCVIWGKWSRNLRFEFWEGKGCVNSI